MDRPEQEEILSRAIYRGLAGAAFLVLALYLAIWFVRVTQLVLLFGMLAVILFLAANGPVATAERHGIKRVWGALALTLVLLAALMLVGVLVVPLLSTQLVALWSNLPQYEARISDWARDLLASYPQAQSWVQSGSVTTGEALRQAPAVLLRISRYTFDALEVFLLLFVLLITVIYMVVSPQPLVRSYLELFPPARRDRAARALARSSQMVLGWMRANLLIGAIQAVAIGAFLALMQVPGSLVWAVLIFLGQLVPTLGPLLMSLPAIGVALAVSPATGFWVLLFYVVLFRLTDDVIAPRVRAAQMQLHPVSIIVGLLSMSVAFGLLGAVLATPVIGIIKAYYLEFGPCSQEADEVLDGRVNEVLSGGPANRKGGTRNTDKVSPPRPECALPEGAAPQE